MASITLLHNPRCSTSRHAVDAADGHDVEIVQYLKTPLSETELLDLIGKLEDDPTDLVRRDATFKELGLSDADVSSPEQVAKVVAEHPKLMQRPVLIRGDRAIIGRPKDRVPAFLAEN